MRERILSEIKRIAKANGGQPPGSQTFENETSIRRHDWNGKYWARWGDALIEAGFSPNKFTAKVDSSILLKKISEACRYFNKLPTASEFKLYKAIDSDFPDYSTLQTHFSSKNGIVEKLKGWLEKNIDYSDVNEFLPELKPKEVLPIQKSSEGFVYLIKSGQFYKIGRGDELEKRVKQIRTALPDASVLEHSIRTDDPSGIEAYWHRRFADKRANGEWFKLTLQDVAAFKKRKFQ